jgi:hypothetical protein
VDGRPRLPRVVRVQWLLSLYQEVLATLAEYRQLVGERSGAGQAGEAQRVLTAMVAGLERVVQPNRRMQKYSNLLAQRSEKRCG